MPNMAEDLTEMRTDKRPLDLGPWEVTSNLLLNNVRTKHFRD